MTSDPRVFVAWAALFVSILVLCVNVWITLRGQRLTVTIADKSAAISQTIEMVSRFHSPEFALIRSSAWSVFAVAEKEEADLDPLVEHLLGRDLSQDARLAQLFPWDKKTTNGLSYFQCVLAVLSFWELWGLLLHSGVVEQSLYPPLLTQYRAWQPALDELIERAEKKRVGEKPLPTWVANIETLRSEWRTVARAG